jgi:uncharacterized LabA/DUF88 family protein
MYARFALLLPIVLTDWWGFFLSECGEMDKVAVFLDYENVHRTGHQLFAGVGEARYGTVVNPLVVAEKLIAKRKNGGMLNSVHVFRGRPVPFHQPKPASANDIQAAAWGEDSRVVVHRRDLKYDVASNGSFVAREKGIDVALAVKLVEGALDQAFDVAIVFSCDTDLLPALEMVFRRGLVHLELGCWSSAKPLWFPEFLKATPSRNLPYCHFLNESDFLEARDYSAVS